MEDERTQTLLVEEEGRRAQWLPCLKACGCCGCGKLVRQSTRQREMAAEKEMAPCLCLPI